METRPYPEVAIRETILKAICHTDYSRPAQIKIEFFVDRLEISSPGNIYGGVTLEEVLAGRQSIRNARLINLMDKLEMIETYGTGLQRALESYEEYAFKPTLNDSPNFFTVILPNINYQLGNATQETTQETSRETLSELKMLNAIKEKSTITRRELAIEIGLTEDGVKYQKDKLRKNNKN